MKKIYLFVFILMAHISCAVAQPTKPTTMNVGGDMLSAEDPEMVSQTPQVDPETASLEAGTLLEEGTPEYDAFLVHYKAESGESCQNDRCFEKELEVDGNQLNLRGIGTRKYLVMDIYTAALYLPEVCNLNEERIPSCAKVMILQYNIDLDKETVVETMNKSLRKNPNIRVNEVKDRFKKLGKAFVAPRKHSRYEFVHIPEKGTAMFHDGELKIVLPGEDFAYALFGVWMGDYNEESPMQRQLLGFESYDDKDMTPQQKKSLQSIQNKFKKLISFS